MIQTSRKKRIKNRLLIHHLVMTIVTCIVLLIFINLVQSEDIIFRWSMATAYTGLIFLAATLFTGPINILRNRVNPISTDLRRDIGIWSALICFVHVVVGLQVHFRGKMLLYFFKEIGQENHLVLRFGQFGFANHTGLIATLIIILLFALSNDFSLRKLKPDRWKIVQRLNYIAFVLIIAHGMLYQIIEKRKLPYIILFSTILILIFIIQLSGFLKKVSKKRNVNKTDCVEYFS
jgi:sulfoxide reductase heme-binding subunit YedZ